MAGESGTSEKHTSQLLLSKSRSRVIKVDASKFYSLPHSLLPFRHSAYRPSFPSPPSFLLPLGSVCCLLALRIINTPTHHRPAPWGRKPHTDAPAWATMTTRTICPSNQSLKEPVLRPMQEDKHIHIHMVDLGQRLKNPISCPDRRGPNTPSLTSTPFLSSLTPPWFPST